MLVLLFGEEDFLVKKRLREIKGDFLKKEGEAPLFSFDLSEEEEVDWEAIFSPGGGLFSEKKMIILKNINLCSEAIQRRIKNAIKKQGADKEKNIWVVGSYVTKKQEIKESSKDQKSANLKSQGKKRNILVEFFGKNCQKKEKFSRLSQGEAFNFVKSQIGKKAMKN